MAYLLIILLILAANHTAAYFLWQRFTRWEVAQNAAAITANGSADDLRAAFHQRRTWLRFWPWLGLTAAGALPLLRGPHFGLVLLSFFSLGVLLAGFFARYFTPWLNAVRGLPEFQASHDSASWPDAGAWKEARANYADSAAASLGYEQQVYANASMRRTLTRTWLLARLIYAAGVLATLAALLYY